MNELKTKLAEVRKAIKAMVAIEEMSDDEAKKLDGLNREAVKLQARVDGYEQAEKEEVETAARIEREKAEAVAEARREEAAKSRRLQFGDAPYQAKYSDLSKYDELSAGETALVIETLNANGRQVSGSAFKALSIKIGEMKDDNTDEGRKGVNYVRNAFKAATNIEPTAEATASAVKAATDPMYTGGSGIGSDWVGTAYSSELWSAIRAANVVVNRVPSEVIPDGYSSKYWPLESTDPTWYKVAEATASDATLKVPAATIAASQLATANKQLTVGKLGARSLYTGELTEDSLIAFAPNLRRQLEVSGAEILEHVAIDGDVETSANKNINDIAGTPAGTEPFLLMDGFRKLALVTNTANSRSAAGTLAIEDFKNTLKLMGVAGLAGADPTKVAFIVDYNVMWAMLDLPELKTRDVSSFATIENGFVTRVYRTDVLYAFQMHRLAADRKAQTDGKIDQDTTTDNTTGSILAVRFDQWKQAFKRRMTLETTRIANADSWEIVALVRWGLAYRDNEASAITYNVGI
jgi:hypothetical protein